MAVLCQNPWRSSVDLSYKEIDSLHWSFTYLPVFQWTNHLNPSRRGVNFYSCIEEIQYLLSSMGGNKKERLNKQRTEEIYCAMQGARKIFLWERTFTSHWKWFHGLQLLGSPEIISPNENFNLSARNINRYLKVPTTTMGRERKHQVCSAKAKMNIPWHINTGP